MKVVLIALRNGGVKFRSYEFIPPTIATIIVWNQQRGKEMNCKNCGHKLYFHNGIDKWNHYTRAYRPYGYPYASKKCCAPMEDRKHCGCENPEPQSLTSKARIQE